MEQREVEAVMKRRHAILNRTTILEKGIKIPDLNVLCGRRQNKTMINI
jgi:transcription-repair coupling factor (superfamily II helicase)